MRPWSILGKALSPDGAALVLYERDGQFSIRVSGTELMSSTAHGSERALAELACEPFARADAPRVLVGGLGMGFTLRAALDKLPANAEVWVAELIPEIVAWNRGPLAELAGRPLEDSRLSLHLGDVAVALAQAPERWDAVMLDVDNGPQALTAQDNESLYGLKGLRRLHWALRPRGVLTVWSAAPDAAFLERLRKAGFEGRAVQTRARGEAGGAKHTIFVGVRGELPPAGVEKPRAPVKKRRVAPGSVRGAAGGARGAAGGARGAAGGARGAAGGARGGSGVARGGSGVAPARAQAGKKSKSSSRAGGPRKTR